MKYVVLFIICLFISFFIVGFLFPGYQTSIGQGGKAAFSLALAIVLTVISAKLIDKIRS